MPNWLLAGMKTPARRKGGTMLPAALQHLTGRQHQRGGSSCHARRGKGSNTQKEILEFL